MGTADHLAPASEIFRRVGQPSSSAPKVQTSDQGGGALRPDLFSRRTQCSASLAMGALGILWRRNKEADSALPQGADVNQWSTHGCDLLCRLRLFGSSGRSVHVAVSAQHARIA